MTIDQLRAHNPRLMVFTRRHSLTILLMYHLSLEDLACAKTKLYVSGAGS